MIYISMDDFVEALAHVVYLTFRDGFRNLPIPRKVACCGSNLGSPVPPDAEWEAEGWPTGEYRGSTPGTFEINLEVVTHCPGCGTVLTHEWVTYEDPP